jgi:4-hydroxy-tetrahydrodipicolinate synthase
VSTVNWGRLMTAMVTPFDKNLEVDCAMAKRLARHLVSTGTDSVLVGGTTGESPTLTAEERAMVLTAVLEEVGGEVPVIAGTGTNSTADSITLTRQAGALGADGIMLVTPYYNKPPQAGLIDHFTRISETTSLPVMVYNVPGRTSVTMLPSTVEKLAAVPNIVAVKEAGGSLDAFTELVERLPSDFTVYCGDDSLTLPAMSVGAYGVVSVASHVAGTTIKQMMEAFAMGDTITAQQKHTSLFRLFKALFMTTSPIPVKAALCMMGIDVGACRPPLCDLTADEARVLENVLVQQSLIKRNVA